MGGISGQQRVGPHRLAGQHGLRLGVEIQEVFRLQAGLKSGFVFVKFVEMELRSGVGHGHVKDMARGLPRHGVPGLSRDGGAEGVRRLGADLEKNGNDEHVSLLEPAAPRRFPPPRKGIRRAPA